MLFHCHERSPIKIHPIDSISLTKDSRNKWINSCFPNSYMNDNNHNDKTKYKKKKKKSRRLYWIKTPVPSLSTSFANVKWPTWATPMLHYIPQSHRKWSLKEDFILGYIYTMFCQEKNTSSTISNDIQMYMPSVWAFIPSLDTKMEEIKSENGDLTIFC